MGLILVVDDDYAQRCFYKHHLEAAGAHGLFYWPDHQGGPSRKDVFDLSNGSVRTNVARLDMMDIDAVLLDYRLHTVDCQEVVDAIRKANPSAPIFLMTGFVEAEVGKFCEFNKLVYISKQEVIERPEYVLDMIERACARHPKLNHIGLVD